METYSLYLGHPPAYWVELQRRFNNVNPGDVCERSALLQEVVSLQGKVAFYEQRVRQMNDFAKVNK